MAAVAGLILSAGRAGAADVTVLRSADNATAGRTLRIPRTGTFTMDPTSAGYLVLATAESDIRLSVGTATWTSTAPGAQPQALAILTSRPGDDGTVNCRSELWGLARPAEGPGFVTVTLKVMSGNPPPPALAGTVISFGNVASTGIGGPCCAVVSNDGSGTTTISKTVDGTSRGDALLNTVCTSWSGATPGTPSADPANDPEMMPRGFIVTGSPNLQHFIGTSPGGEADRPATKYRHLRWLQSGDRVWALTALQLFATAAAPPDAAPPPPPDAGASPPRDTGVPPPPDAAQAAVDAAPAPDQSSTPPEPSVRLDGNLSAVPGPDARAPLADEPPDAALPEAGGPHVIDLRVGCACTAGATDRGGHALWALLLPALLLRRRAGRR
jgi:hypothetical protein